MSPFVKSKILIKSLITKEIKTKSNKKHTKCEPELSGPQYKTVPYSIVTQIGQKRRSTYWVKRLNFIT